MYTMYIYIMRNSIICFIEIYTLSRLHIYFHFYLRQYVIKWIDSSIDLSNADCLYLSLMKSQIIFKAVIKRWKNCSNIQEKIMMNQNRRKKFITLFWNFSVWRSCRINKKKSYSFISRMFFRLRKSLEISTVTNLQKKIYICNFILITNRTRLN